MQLEPAERAPHLVGDRLSTLADILPCILPTVVKICCLGRTYCKNIYLVICMITGKLKSTCQKKTTFGCKFEGGKKYRMYKG